MKEVEKIVDNAMKATLSDLVTTLQPAVGSADQREAYGVKMADLNDLPSPECFLFEWLRPFGFTSSQIQQIAGSLDAQSGKIFQTASYVLYIDRNELVVAPVYQPVSPMKIPEEGVYKYQEDIKFRISSVDDLTISKSDNCVTIDKEKVEFPLTIRIIQLGDRFVPFGMNGSKLVSDYLTDKKVSLWSKLSQMVVTDAKGEVVWLVGHRIDHRFRITPSTTSVLKLELV